MFIDKYYEEYEIGESRESYGRTITESDIVIHAGQTGDFYPHHMDAEWCKTQPFGQRMAHGTLTFAIAAGLGAGDINNKSMTYGYERLRFPRPVFIGDTVHGVFSITEKKPHPRKPGYGLVTERVELKNQNDETVLVCDHVHFVECREK
ncbi:MaoC family dehydratase [Oceanidesulfovibrio marinus]|uniref:Dehydratase n=1 Tax=Oceanidesulfovibrio marinus TaxID=370038 RepID=A0A6P1ZIX0_9BACT|nr:MaoC/PaaZ C-terminal domain-containing protein [Oceanidesulfovibrio marinus]QJT07574.1 dehydratase [Oceanidesulfovibrio marinus]TVM34512.1 dehydratase [Oceanidesulfovibrio marinus]